MPTGFRDVPDWTFWENQGAAVAVADLGGGGAGDLVVFVIDDAVGLNRGLFRVGRALDADGVVTGGWTQWTEVPDWFSWENQGGGDRRGRPGRDPRPRRLHCRQPAGCEPGNLPGGPGPAAPTAWSPAAGRRGATFRTGRSGRTRAPVWRSPTWAAGASDLLVFVIDDPVEKNRRPLPDRSRPGCRRRGHRRLVGVDGGARLVLVGEPGRGRSRWSTGARPATSSSSPSTTRPARTRRFYRVAANIDVKGNPATGWSPWRGVPNWFSWENQGAGIAASDVGGPPDPHRADGRRPAGSERRALHTAAARRGPGDPGQLGAAAVLLAGARRSMRRPLPRRQGHVLRRLRQQPGPRRLARLRRRRQGHLHQRRLGSAGRPRRAGPNFAHPATVRGTDGKPFDFFCGGDTFLPDGTLLSAGGNLAYPGNGHGNLGRADCLGFDPVGGQWRNARARWRTAAGTRRCCRWPTAGCWPSAASTTPTARSTPRSRSTTRPPTPGTSLHVPQGGLFFGMPLYAHLFLLR